MINKNKKFEGYTVTDNSNDRKPLIATLETKPSNQDRPQPSQPTPLTGCSDKSKN